jgi:hypothetical protein
VTEDETDRGTCRVLDPDAGRANAVEVGTTGATVSEFAGNEQFPDDDRVVTVAFEGALDADVPEWDEWDAAALHAELDAYADEWGVTVRTYDYPESRLTSVETDTDGHEGDGPDGEPRRHVEDLRDVDTHEEPEDLEPRTDGGDETDETATDGGTAAAGDEWNPEPATLREGETPDVSSHARRNAEQLRLGRRDLGKRDALDANYSRGERIRARRLVNAVAPCDPQAALPEFDVFGEVRREVAGSILLAAGVDLRDLAETADTDEVSAA